MQLRPFGMAGSSMLIALGLLSSVAARDGGWINPNESMPAVDMPSTEAGEGVAGSDQGNAHPDTGNPARPDAVSRLMPGLVSRPSARAAAAPWALRSAGDAGSARGRPGGALNTQRRISRPRSTSFVGGERARNRVRVRACFPAS